jgi:hypothetical protein
MLHLLVLPELCIVLISRSSCTVCLTRGTLYLYQNKIVSSGYLLREMRRKATHQKLQYYPYSLKIRIQRPWLQQKYQKRKTAIYGRKFVMKFH